MRLQAGGQGEEEGRGSRGRKRGGEAGVKWGQGVGGTKLIRSGRNGIPYVPFVAFQVHRLVPRSK